METVAYRISYLDASSSPRLVAVAETLTDARAVAGLVTTAIPQTVDRMVIAEDPLLGLVSRVIQPPQSLDVTLGLPVLYLGGTILPDRNWQAHAIRTLSAEPVVIANPRRELPAAGDGGQSVQIAWQRRHLWQADIGL